MCADEGGLTQRRGIYFTLRKHQCSRGGAATAKNWCETDLASMGDNTVFRLGWA
jgi:hypothetical protein